MKRLFALLLLGCSPVLATPPIEALLEEIAGLREQVGQSGRVVADEEDFAEALRGVASQAGHAEARDGAAEPSGPSLDRPRSDHAHQFRAAPKVPAPTIPPPWRPQPAPWPGVTEFSDRVFPAPPRPPRPSKVLLRESAFAIDRIAHELEMAELGAEADALRTAASKLRRSARKAAERSGSESGAAPSTKSAAGATDQRRGRWDAMPQLDPNETWIERAKKRRSRRQRRPKLPSPDQTLKERRLDLIGPPAGVYGGPTEPPDELEE